MSDLKVKVIGEISEDFLKEWKNLWQRSNFFHYFNSCEWFLACCDTFKIKNFYIFSLYDDKDLVAVLPLIFSKRWGVSVLRSPGGNFFNKSSLLVLERKFEYINTLIQEVKKYSNFYLAELTKDFRDVILANQPSMFSRLTSRCYYINLTEGSLKHLSKKQKSKIKNKILKNQKLLSYRYFKRNLDRHLNTIFSIESESSKYREGKAIFTNPKVRTLFYKMVVNKSGFFRLDIIAYKGKPTVYGLGIINNGHYLGHQTAFDAKYTHIIPGKILLYSLLQQLEKEGYQIFDFGRGENALKKEFARYFYDQYDIYFSQNILVRAWWKIGDFATKSAKNNQFLYQIICRVKKYFSEFNGSVVVKTH